MTTEKIKIVSIGEDVHPLKNIKSSYHFEKQYSLIQTDFDNFQKRPIEYDILLFAMNNTSPDQITQLFSKLSFEKERPVILVCEGKEKEEAIRQIPFKNKFIFSPSVSSDDLSHNISMIVQKTNMERRILEFEKQLTKLTEINIHLTAELESVKQENELNKLNIQELSSTNEHLIAATWRERDLKKQLKEAMDSINESKNIIEEQNRRIEQSINYARKIQQAIHTKETDLKSILPQSSVYFKPKDVISGDFPWMFVKDDYVYLAAVDCTGHGVPGAMMSMIGNLLLNDLAHETGEHTPGQILDRLHSRVIKTLKQDSAHNNANDGMDIAMIRIHIKTNEVLFASAHRPLLHVTKTGKVSILKGDRFPIGGLHYEKQRIPFTDTCIQIEKDDMLFMFTDGLTDQIGGEQGKKIGTKNIFEILSHMAQLETDQITTYINEQFETWKGPNKQIDDVLLIALRY